MGHGQSRARSSHKKVWQHCAAHGKMGLDLGVLHSPHRSPVPLSLSTAEMFHQEILLLSSFPHSESLSQKESMEPSGVRQLLYTTTSIKAWRQMQGYFVRFFARTNLDDVSATYFLQRRVLWSGGPQRGTLQTGHHRACGGSFQQMSR